MGERERWGKSQTETDRQTEGAGEREERTQRGWGKGGGGREGGRDDSEMGERARWECEGGGGGGGATIKV